MPGIVPAPAIFTADADLDGLAWFLLPLIRQWPAAEPCPVVGIISRNSGGLSTLLPRIRPDCRVLTFKPTAPLHAWRQFQERLREIGLPRVIHAIGPIASRMIYLHTNMPYLGIRPRPRILISDTDWPGSGILGWWTRLASRQADRVLAWSRVQSHRYRNLGVARGAIDQVALPAEPPWREQDRAAWLEQLQLPSDARLIMTSGRFVSESDMKTAIWSFDIIKYTDPRLALVLIGHGPEQERLERFGRAIGFDDYRIRFWKPEADLAGLFSLADLVWIVHRRRGIRETLAAMAAARPIIAVRNPDLTELIQDGETGRFVSAGDRVGLAAVTSEWLRQPHGGAACGRAAKVFAEQNFCTKRFVERLRSLYHNSQESSTGQA
jgi:glycosyltransferase involved in cell wall biosynthesis